LREWEEGLKARNRGIIAIFCPGEGEVFFSPSLSASEGENRPNDQESLLIFYFYFLKL